MLAEKVTSLIIYNIFKQGFLNILYWFSLYIYSGEIIWNFMFI